MSNQVLKFLILIGIFFAFTIYRAGQIWPAHRLLMSAVTLPLVILMFGSQWLYRLAPGVWGCSWFHIASWVGSIFLGLWATFMLISLPFDILHLFLKGWNGIRSLPAQAYEVGVSLDRRVFFSQGLNASLFALSGGLASLGLFQVFLGPRVRRVKVKVIGLPPAMKDLKIAQISDLHIGPTIRKNYVEDVVRQVNETNPDLLFVTGDLADAKAMSIDEELEPFCRVKARLGVYYVTGNHEYYWDAPGLISKVRALGWIPLINENRIIPIADTKLLIGGVTDPMGAHFSADHSSDLKKAVASSEPSDFKILLAHRPGVCLEAESLGFDLQFSGHTHAGQFFPFCLLIPLFHKYYRGLNRHGRMWVYVNSGTGYWGPANRFAVAPEISLVHLHG